MTPLAQSNLEHGQDFIVPELEHVETPVHHVEYTQQGSMALHTATVMFTDANSKPNWRSPVLVSLRPPV